jgi:predicted dithiol-disulfide oxidoreductase (DUF899 family)
MNTSPATGAKPRIVSPEEWAQERAELLVAEKAVTHAEDAVAARRRRLPMVRFRPDYAFAAPSGPVSLLDLFAGHDQLLVYQFMDVGPDHVCPGCTWFTDGVPAHGLARLAQAGVSWATVSDMPLEQMRGVWEEKGWMDVPFASSRGTTFSADCGVGGGFLLSVFLRDGDEVYRTYSTTQRGSTGWSSPTACATCCRSGARRIGRTRRPDGLSTRPTAEQAPGGRGMPVVRPRGGERGTRLST